jgi:hypothetical protein
MTEAPRVLPQWAQDAAEEIYWSEDKRRSSVSWCNIQDLAEIIAKHASKLTTGVQNR